MRKTSDNDYNIKMTVCDIEILFIPCLSRKYIFSLTSICDIYEVSVWNILFIFFEWVFVLEFRKVMHLVDF